MSADEVFGGIELYDDSRTFHSPRRMLMDALPTQPVVFADNSFAAYFVHSLLGLGNIVCLVLVLIQMFNKGRPELGVTTIVLLFCFGIGALVAFTAGWFYATKWNIKTVMLIWTVFFVIGIAMNFVLPIHTTPQDVF
jgi:hypothetical protein